MCKRVNSVCHADRARLSWDNLGTIWTAVISTDGTLRLIRARTAENNESHLNAQNLKRFLTESSEWENPATSFIIFLFCADCKCILIFSITPYFLTKRKNQNLDIDKPFVWCYLVDRFLTLSHKLRERCEHGFLSCGSSAANCRCRTEGYGIFYWRSTLWKQG